MLNKRFDACCAHSSTVMDQNGSRPRNGWGSMLGEPEICRQSLRFENSGHVVMMLVQRGDTVKQDVGEHSQG
jgi:hypothetical protein